MPRKVHRLGTYRKTFACLTIGTMAAVGVSGLSKSQPAGGDPALYDRLALSGHAGADRKEVRGLRAVAAAAGDFDGDGVPDLAVAYASADRGRIRIYRGNLDSIFPNDPSARNRREEGIGSDLPFLPGIRTFSVPDQAALLAAGDFDNDRRIDLITAGRGADALYFLAGDGQGGFSAPRRIAVGGAVTAMASGDLDRADGLTDVLVGIEAGGRASALLFSGPEGALASQPEVVDLPAAASAFVIGRLDDDYAVDFAAAAGRGLVLISGRDAITDPAGGTRRLERHEFDSPLLSAALAELDGQPGAELSVLTRDGVIHVLARFRSEGAESSAAIDVPLAASSQRLAAGDRPARFDPSLTAMPPDASAEALAAATGKPTSRGEWRETWSELLASSPAGLVPLRITGEEARSLVVVETGASALRVLAMRDSASRDSESEASAAAASPLSSRMVDVGDSAAAVLPMRLNADGIPDLVVLQEGSIEPALIVSRAAAVFVVNSAGDGPDCNTGDATCATNSGGCPNGPCTLRAAIMQANASGGADVIQFSIGAGPVTIAPTSFLPNLTGAVTIDGTTQPGFAGSPIIEIDGIGAGNPANGLTVDGGSSTIRGLVIGRFTFRGIEVRSPGNFIEGNYLGTNVAGTAARSNFLNGILVNNFAGNVIGGLVPQARNLVSGNNGDGIEIFGGGATGNLVQGNYIGTNAAGTAALGNGVGSSCALGADGPGLVVNAASNNTLGGTTAGARNIVSGNLCDGIVISGPAAGGNLIQGNYVGTNPAGTAAVPNSSNAFGGGIRIVAPTTTVGGTAAGAGNLVSGNFEDGIEIPRPDMFGNVVQGNFVGTDVNGTAALGNEIVGILIPLLPGGAIGGTTAAARNVVSGNAYGIALIADAHDVLIQGNYVGTNAAGTAALGNSIGGLLIEEGQNITVGGAAAGAGNVFSGNLHGVIIANGASTGNLVRGNRIGTRPDGTTALANTGRGVFFTEGAIHNEVGGTAAGAGNTIAFNGGIGVWVEAVDTGTGLAKENSILGNSVFSNGGLGIDLDPVAVTPNDLNDPDTGSNLRQNFPVITTVGPPNITLVGTLNSTPSTSFRLEFFSSALADPSGNGEGQTFLGFTNVATNASGNASFNVTFPGSLPTNHVVTATATDPAGNTSEYSCAAPCRTRDLIVNTTDDGADSDTGDDYCDADGAAPGNQCTLRAAIQTANLRAGTDTITFDITGAGVHTISPGSALPTITQPVTLDATSQPGFTNTPLIRLDGASAGGANGLTITAGDSTVKGFVITRFGGHGILLQTGGNNTVQGCILGSDANGATGLGNGGNGVFIENSSNNTIGGVGSAAQLSGLTLRPQSVHSVAFVGAIGNMIGGNLLNGIGISGLGSIANKVLGNLSGMLQNLTGAYVKVPNLLAGLLVNNGKQTEIGALLGGNVFSGNGQFGVQVNGQGAVGNKLFANIVGTDPNGATGVGNGKDGVSILDAVGTILGGNATGEGNTVAGNAEYGVQITSTSLDCAQQMLTEMHKNAIGIFQAIQLSQGPGKSAPAAPASFAALGNLLGGLKVNNSAGNILGKLGVGGLLSNLIGANQGPGVWLTGPCAKLNKLLNNSIGTDTVGTAGLGNMGEGVLLEGASENEIGGATSDLGNVISGNMKDGIKLKSLPDLLARLNKLSQNNIGGKPDGSGPLGNLLNGINADTAPETMIESNAVVGNSRYGIYSENVSLQQLQAQQRQIFDQINKILEMYNNTAGTIVSGIGRQTAGGPHKSRVQFAAIGNLLGGLCMNGALKNIIGGPGGLANIISGNQGPGVHFKGIGATLNKLLGNFIGTTPTGLSGFGNTGEGVFVEGAPNNEIGGLATGEGNVISGNAKDGVLLKSLPDSLAGLNKILGNNIGAKPDGSGPLGNLLNGISTDTAPNTLVDSNITVANTRYGVYSENTQLNALTAQMRQLFDQATEIMKMIKNTSGVYTTALRGGQLSVGEIGKSRVQFVNMGNLLGGLCLNGALKNIIGGPGGLANLFAGNQGPGVHMRGIGATLNKLLGNFIGTTPTGLAGFGNSGEGVFIDGAGNNEVGGLGTGEGNVISGNQGNGILLKSLSDTLANLNKILGNNIGAKPDGSGPLGNLLNGISADTAPDTLIDSNITVANGRYGVYSENTQLNALNAQMRALFDQASEIMKMIRNASGVYTTALRGGQLSVGEIRKTEVQFINMGNLLGGLCLNGALKNTIGGGLANLANIFAGNQGPGVHLRGIGALLNKLLGNYIGTTPTALPGFGNTLDGVFIEGAVQSTVDGNTIVSNLLRGIRIQDQSARLNQLIRNLIGVAPNLQGLLINLPNLQGGILISDSPDNIIGTPVVAAGTVVKAGPRVITTGGNVISGNTGPGLTFTGAEAKQNLVQSNFIGTDDTGFGHFGNNSHGVFLTSAARLNVIGGPAAGAGNVIAYNTGAGVSLDASAGHCNVVDPNSMFANGGPGIDLNNDGAPTPNDVGDPDSGPNKLQNFPEMTSANIQPNGDLVISYKVDSNPSNSNYGTGGLLVEFFKADKGLEGRFFAGNTHYTVADYNNGTPGVATVNLGTASLSNVYPGDRIVATATDADNNTSEFTSVGVGVIPGLPGTAFYTVTPCRVADTRDAPGPYGAPALAAGAERTYTIGGRCGIPVTAKAVSFNITVTGPTFFGHLSLYPGATFPPLVSSINFRAGQTRANNAIVVLGAGATLAVSNGQPTGTTEFIIDINGYFE